LADKVFTESRVRIMLNELKKRLSKSRNAFAEQLKTLTAELEKNQRSLERLYHAVEEGMLPMDATLSERAHRLQAQRQAILTEIAGIRRQKEMPQQLLSSRNVAAFCQALKARLFDRSSGFGKRYLRLLVDEIRVMGK
jgi:primosomal protein N''